MCLIVKFRNGPLWGGSTEHRANGTTSTSMDKMLPDPENSSWSVKHLNGELIN